MAERIGGLRPVSEDNAAAAARLGSTALALDIVGVVTEAPALRRITVGDPRLRDVEWHPGQDLTLSIPTGGRPVRRRYTIRRLDRDTATAELQVLLHGDGPGARWATAASAGDHLEAVGPRGKIWADPAAQWHLFVGDETFLPATFAMVESLPSGTPAIVALEVGDDIGEQPPDAAADVTGPLWVRRGRGGGSEDSAQLAQAVDGTHLAQAVAGMELPAGPGHAYAGGEHRAVAAVRAALIGRGLPPEAISAKAYWRRDKPNQGHGEPERD